MQAALGLFHARPAALPARAGAGAVRAADRVVAAGVQRVDGEVALGDVGRDVLVGPVGERARLPELVALVPAELRGVRARRRLDAPDACDPAVDVGESACQRLDLADGAAEVGLTLPQRLPV